MVYVISDLHGYPHEKFLELLEKANFNDNDFLFILGDLIDRNGDGGAKTLYWLIEQNNIQLILGNHEAMLLSCSFLFDEITDENINNLTSDKMDLINNYMLNGGDVTLKSLKSLTHEQQQSILEYLREAPLYETVTAGNKDFLLVHSGIDNFCKNKKISEYSSDDLLWAWPELEDTYYDDIITIFGHTPTMSYGDKYKGKIIITDTWINIDVGTGYGMEPVLLRLDDLSEIRLSN